MSEVRSINGSSSKQIDRKQNPQSRSLGLKPKQSATKKREAAVPARVKSRITKQSKPRDLKATNKARSWTARSDYRASVAALEWDLFYEQHAGDLDALEISRDDYVFLARNLRLEPGENLRTYVLDYGIVASKFRDQPAFMILCPTVGFAHAMQAVTNRDIEPELHRATLELVRRDLMALHPLSDGKIFYVRCRMRTELNTTDDTALWQASVTKAYFDMVPGLSDL